MYHTRHTSSQKGQLPNKLGKFPSVLRLVRSSYKWETLRPQSRSQSIALPACVAANRKISKMSLILSARKYRKEHWLLPMRYFALKYQRLLVLLQMIIIHYKRSSQSIQIRCTEVHTTGSDGLHKIDSKSKYFYHDYLLYLLQPCPS